MSLNLPSQAIPDVPPPPKLIQQVSAYRTSQAIRVVVELGIPLLLEQCPRSAKDLAASAGVQAPLLARILDHLVNEEVFGRDGQGLYYNLVASRYLVPGHAYSLEPWISFELHPVLWRAWEKLVEQLRTNRPAFELAHGCPLFEWLATDEGVRERFDTQMRVTSKMMGSVAVSQAKFQPGTTIVDVGGGDGSLLGQVLVSNPGTTGILFELPSATRTLDPFFAELVAGARARIVHGSFLESVPTQGDAYVFSQVLHDFEDEAAERILRNTQAAMNGHGRLIIVEMVVNPLHPEPWKSAQDILLMVLLGGHERTVDEFSQLLARCGFALVSTTPTRSPLSLLECRSAER